MDDAALAQLAARLAEVDGVVGALLGGSRARGAHLPDSDTDIGVYYRTPLDIDGLRDVARDVAGDGARLTAPGEWGRWVDGGGWLRIEGQPVDWIYRDVERVRAAWDSARQGRYRFHFQVGHPLGFPDFTYAGEIALGDVLADPTGELSALQHETRDYPEPLAGALIERLDEAAFIIEVARKAVPRGDATFVAGCLFRAIGVCAHALHGAARRWLIHEKGAVATAGRLPVAPAGFEGRAGEVFTRIAVAPTALVDAVTAAAALIDDTTAACEPLRPGR